LLLLFFFRNFPNYYYALEFTIPGGKIVDIIMLDTILLCGNTAHDFVGDQPHGPDNMKMSEDQWTWLELQLMASQ
jgi:tartrate-resistant acid phosphatase type 5